MFTEELNFFIANQEDLVREHHGKVLALKGREILGVYPDALTAYLETQKKYPVGTFMIQPCAPGPEAYTVTISSIALSF
jgi:hypothetical protein